MNSSKTDYNENIDKIVDYYFSMVQTACPIIRKHDPNAKILLFGGLNLYSQQAPNAELDKDFASRLAPKNVGRFGDAVSIHAYTWNETYPTVMYRQYDASLTFYNGLFNGKLELWITETGKPLEEAGEVAQAQCLADALDFFQGRASHVFWYSLLDNPGEYRFGLVEADLTPRPAYLKLQNYTAT
ncbi:MAG: hypothetical protein NWE98_04275 [Candidatus Bathyarchaeota archaeon]|nr:hypothetical protein [Candidatus Bathyarchaeota archaeon]